jgi:hypothetical protein
MAPRKTETKKQTRTPKTQKAAKPVFRMGTWVTIILFVAMLGIVYIINRNAETTAEAESTPTVEAQFVFDSTSLVTSIEVKPLDGETFKVERKENAWVVTQPIELEADAGLVEAAASQIASLRIIQEIEGDPSEFGFDEPSYIITIEFENGDKNILEVGDSTPTNNGYYVRVDNKIMILSLSGIDSLTTLAVFPPYLHTPTPTSTPLPATETLVPTIEATPTP